VTAADLGFTPAWAAAGVLTPELLADLVRLAAGSPRPPRWWRWVAFREFVEGRERLTAAECRALFELGVGEPDRNLGTAIACHVLSRHTCPPEVRDAARASDRAAVRRAAGPSPG
jgi:hypothetical protein